MRISTTNSIYIHNRNLQTKPQIRFGESEGFYPERAGQETTSISPKEAKWLAQKNKIEASYRKRIENLSNVADECEMSNEVYWDNVRAIQKEKDLALRQAHVLFLYEK